MKTLARSVVVGALCVVSVGACKSGGRRDAETASPARVAGYDAELYDAARRGSRARVEKRLDAGAAINEPNPANGRTALHAAADGGHKKLVSELLERGANANVQDSDGNTPLHLAAMHGHEDTTLQLLGRTNLSVRNKDGKTAREVATGAALRYFPAP